MALVHYTYLGTKHPERHQYESPDPHNTRRKPFFKKKVPPFFPQEQNVTPPIFSDTLISITYSNLSEHFLEKAL